MKQYILILIAFTGLANLFSSCEKDETKATMLKSPVVPEITTVPSDLVLKRTEPSRMLNFAGTKGDFGFTSSATYYLEADSAGRQFKNPVVLASNKTDTFNISVGNLNTILIRTFPTNIASAIELRVRVALTIEASGATPIESFSTTKPVSITTYGLPRLDLIGTGVTGKIESLLGDGKYLGYLNLDNTKSFTLKDPEANIAYGIEGKTLVENGINSVKPDANGWYKIEADTKGLTFDMAPFNIGLVGSATPNGWNAPDSKMAYDSKSGSWFITLTLVDGSVKFRKNDEWNQGINLGIGTGYSIDNLYNNSSSSDIPVTAGKYTVRLYIDSTPFKCTFTKNN